MFRRDLFFLLAKHSLYWCVLINTTDHCWYGETDYDRFYFIYFFCFLFLLFVGLDRAQNTKDNEMHKNNWPVEMFGGTRKTKQCAGSRFVQRKTKQLCPLTLKLGNNQHLKTIHKQANTKEMFCRTITITDNTATSLLGKFVEFTSQ